MSTGIVVIKMPCYFRAFSYDWLSFFQIISSKSYIRLQLLTISGYGAILLYL